MKFTIRPAGPGDMPGILEVLSKWNMHHIPSPEMPELDLSFVFVAVQSGRIIGLGGYKLLSPGLAKTTLLAVLPEFQGYGLGRELHDIRLDAMRKAGVRKVTTNADDLKAVSWYMKHYGARVTGSLRKVCSFGLPHVDHWTMMETDLDAYYRNLPAEAERKARYVAENDPPPLSPYPPLLINVCLTGMMPTKTNSPFVPVTPDEIIDDAIRVYDAGARIVHIHARDDAGVPTSDPARFEAIVSGIRRERKDLVCCVTTSGRFNNDTKARAEVLGLSGMAKPDMASLTLGSMNFFRSASVNTIEAVEYLAATMKDKGIKPEMEIFDAGMVNLAKYLERHGFISGRKYFNILLGNLNTAAATLGDIAHITGALPDDSLWAVTGLGRFQLPMNVASIVGGGHIRVGVEDSIFYDYREETLASNEDLVKRIVRIASELQRRVATPDEARDMLGLPPRRSS